MELFLLCNYLWWTVGRSVGVRSHDYQIFHGAPLARIARESSAKTPEKQHKKYDLKTQSFTYCSLLSAAI